MNADDLTPSQAQKIYMSLRQAFAYLASLQNRMEPRGWDQNDRLYLEVKTARDAMQLLRRKCTTSCARRGSSGSFQFAGGRIGGMDENPYMSPGEVGYFRPKPRPVRDWLRDRMTELVLGLVVAVAVLPIVIAWLWLRGLLR